MLWDINLINLCLIHFNGFYQFPTKLLINKLSLWVFLGTKKEKCPPFSHYKSVSLHSCTDLYNLWDNPCLFVPSADQSWRHNAGFHRLGVRKATLRFRNRTDGSTGLSSSISWTSTKMDTSTCWSCGRGWRPEASPGAPWRGWDVRTPQILTAVGCKAAKLLMWKMFSSF